MVLKQETICDSCKKRVADRKCTLCQKDLCSSCSRHSFELVMRVGIILGTILSVPFLASLFSDSLALKIVSVVFQILIVLIIATEMDKEEKK